MLKCFVRGEHGLTLAGSDAAALTDQAIWIDLREPTEAEDHAVESRYGISVPSREEMRDLENSSRLYTENDCLYMTVTLATITDAGAPETVVATFILSTERLVTVRFADPVPFRRWLAFAENHAASCTSATNVFTGLIESIIERLAEVLETLGSELDELSADIFSDESNHGSFNHRDAQLRAYVQQFGRKGNLLSKLRESLVSLGRTMAFAQQPNLPVITQETRHHLQTIQQDVAALNEHASFIAGKISFLLEATLGMISIQQNRLLNIFSIAAVVLMPPTLIAGIYGMNFDFMPELKWHYGYALAVLAMIASAVLPLWYLRRRDYL